MSKFILAASIFLLPLSAFAQSSDLTLEICNDSLYQVLKSKNINELQEREYEYFNRVDKDCNQMKLIQKEKEGQKGEKALRAVGTIIGIMVSVGGLILMYYLIKPNL